MAKRQARKEKTRRIIQRHLLFLLVIIAITAITAFGYLKVKRHTITTADAYPYTTVPIKLNNKLLKTQYPHRWDGEDYYVALQALADGLGCEYTALGNEIQFHGHTLNRDEHPEIIHVDSMDYVNIIELRNWNGFHASNYKRNGFDSDFLYIDTFEKAFSYGWTESHLIAHGLGSVDGDKMTCSLEAFQESYAAGIRVFEADISVTSDDELVLIHDWKKNTLKDRFGLEIDEKEHPLSLDEFLSQKVYGEYTTLSLEDMLELMSEYPDIYFVTDTKEMEDMTTPDQLQKLYDLATRIDSSVLDRVIPQFYSEKMFEDIMDIYPWKSVIYTLYRLPSSFSEEETVAFVYENGIRVVTMDDEKQGDYLIGALSGRGIRVYMHTYNTVKDYDHLRSLGVYGVYSDLLRPAHIGM